MGVIFDTNILIAIVRAGDQSGILKYLNPVNSKVYISIVSEGEIKSLALQNKWGSNRINALERLLNQITIIDITNVGINTYSEIDSYSQLRNPSFKKYPFTTPRNMGKNDLWIASLAALLGLELVTADSDFDHLHDVFCDVKRIDQREFLPFFIKN
ncbi:type II toxin-antitoxin system VapC family toxin [Dyadobacter psychrophilus]|uniref:PIN domain-containing protein n=1 Tax=Dyadobacter psychrophilus TaxID=651661 RepID=A0A1T5HBQ3_9BACT|nr:type II toxin-antitoxin system VapC family toxin [Dyadobacter psychrophilus]SKC18145.1 hypothetical protein SAMN05660293_05267 [Dyadobacter psychrophilus]